MLLPGSLDTALARAYSFGIWRRPAHVVAIVSGATTAPRPSGRAAAGL